MGFFTVPTVSFRGLYCFFLRSTPDAFREIIAWPRRHRRLQRSGTRSPNRVAEIRRLPSIPELCARHRLC